MVVVSDASISATDKAQLKGTYSSGNRAKCCLGQLCSGCSKTSCPIEQQDSLDIVASVHVILQS